MAKQETVSLRKHLDSLLRMQGAHLSFEAAVADFPVALRGAKPAGAPHSAWELLEHMRIAQEDILDFSRNPDYREKSFPPITGRSRKRRRARRHGPGAWSGFRATCRRCRP